MPVVLSVCYVRAFGWRGTRQAQTSGWIQVRLHVVDVFVVVRGEANMVMDAK
jgi:mannose-6-phosphate isomerase-like protein (cupin superfamily)